MSAYFSNNTFFSGILIPLHAAVGALSRQSCFELTKRFGEVITLCEEFRPLGDVSLEQRRVILVRQNTLQQIHMVLICNAKKLQKRTLSKLTFCACLIKSTISFWRLVWTFWAPLSSHRHTEWTDLKLRRKNVKEPEPPKQRQQSSVYQNKSCHSSRDTASWRSSFKTVGAMAGHLSSNWNSFYKIMTDAYNLLTIALLHVSVCLDWEAGSRLYGPKVGRQHT